MEKNCAIMSKGIASMKVMLEKISEARMKITIAENKYMRIPVPDKKRLAG